MYSLPVAEQLENCKVALQLWLETPAEKVVPGLGRYVCDTQACFGGHLARWDYFKAKGVYTISPFSEPSVQGKDAFVATDEYLFGHAMFDPSTNEDETSEQSHALIVHRLTNQIMELQNGITASN